MKKTIEILTAWKNVVTGDEEIKKLAEERKQICAGCEFQIEMLGIETCGVCHCPILGKTHSPVNSCPKGKWVK